MSDIVRLLLVSLGYLFGRVLNPTYKLALRLHGGLLYHSALDVGREMSGACIDYCTEHGQRRSRRRQENAALVPKMPALLSAPIGARQPAPGPRREPSPSPRRTGQSTCCRQSCGEHKREACGDLAQNEPRAPTKLLPCHLQVRRLGYGGEDILSFYAIQVQCHNVLRHPVSNLDRGGCLRAV